jgi:hypothetical protein
MHSSHGAHIVLCGGAAGTEHKESRADGSSPGELRQVGEDITHNHDDFLFEKRLTTGWAAGRPL